MEAIRNRLLITGVFVTIIIGLVVVPIVIVSSVQNWGQYAGQYPDAVGFGIIALVMAAVLCGFALGTLNGANEITRYIESQKPTPNSELDRSSSNRLSQ